MAMTISDRVVAAQRRIQPAWDLRLRDPTAARAQAQDLLHQATDEGDEVLAAYAHSVLAIADARHGQTAQALDFCLNALETFTRIGDDVGLMRVSAILSTIYIISSDYESAMESIDRCLKLADAVGDKQVIASCLNNLGVIYSDQGQFEQAVVAFNQVLGLHLERGDKNGQALAWNNLSVDQAKLGHFEDALQAARQSASLFDEVGNRTGYTRAVGNMANAHAGLGHTDEAERLLRRACDLADAHGFPGDQAISREKLAAFYAEQQDLRALPLAQEGLRLAEQIGDRKMQSSLHLMLAQIAEGEGDFERALSHHKQYHSLHVDMFNEQNTRRVQMLEVQHRTRTALQQARIARERADMLEQQRAHDRHYFEHLTQMKDEVLNAASHDLKNPLAVVNIATHMLRRGAYIQDPAGLRYIDRIESSVQRMTELIASLLDLARLETGSAISKTTQDLNAYLHQVAMAYTPQASAQGIAFHVQVSHEPLLVPFDPPRLRQAIENLVTNAIKYTPAGGTVRLRATAAADQVTIDVQDTGIGIPQDALPRLFDRFYRVDDPQHRSTEGTGLGLSIVKSIVEQHGGQVGVTSTPGSGSTFSLRLPLFA